MESMRARAALEVADHFIPVKSIPPKLALLYENGDREELMKQLDKLHLAVIFLKSSLLFEQAAISIERNGHGNQEN